MRLSTLCASQPLELLSLTTACIRRTAAPPHSTAHEGRGHRRVMPRGDHALCCKRSCERIHQRSKGRPRPGSSGSACRCSAACRSRSAARLPARLGPASPAARSPGRIMLHSCTAAAARQPGAGRRTRRGPTGAVAVRCVPGRLGQGQAAAYDWGQPWPGGAFEHSAAAWSWEKTRPAPRGTLFDLNTVHLVRAWLPAVASELPHRGAKGRAFSCPAFILCYVVLCHAMLCCAAQVR